MRGLPLLLACAVLLAGCAQPSPPPPPGALGSPPAPGAPPAPRAPPALGLAAVADGLASPVFLTHAGDGSGRLYLVEQAGRVRLVEQGRLRAEPFLDISPLVGSGGERGLLGLAFAPGGQRFYVHYTDRAGDTVLARYGLLPTGAADPLSARVLLTVSQPYANHNGGWLAFGPDGMLYLALGDGGAGGDPHGHGQDKATLLGSILRLDVRGESLAVPRDNPFAQGGGRAEVWAYGLRNPWRASFDRATGDLWIGDVGQGAREEVDYAAAPHAGRGANFGWAVWEGSRRHNALGDAPGAVFPVAEYNTREQGRCAITGGYVYRGAAIPGLVGVYLYGDYCTGEVWGLWPEAGVWKGALLLDADVRISSFGEDEAGELYLVGHGGTVHRLAAR